jgi:hypothetical protein
MANSYIAIPNVLPGNVTIGGNLTVAGNVLTIGTFTEKLRLAVDSANQAKLSWNQQGGGSTRDNAAKVAQALFLGAGASQLDLEVQNTAGAAMDTAVPQTIFADYTNHTNTGNTTENTIYSKLVRANLLGSNGALRLTVNYAASVQGATPSTIRVKIGPTIIATFSIPAADNGLVSCMTAIIGEANATNAQTTISTKSVSGIAPSLGLQNTGISMTGDVTLTVTIQSGANSDQQDFKHCSVELMNIWGPVT